MRQYPLEVDPPEHTESRKLVEPFFARPKLPEVIAQVEALADRMVAEAIRQESTELVRDVAVVLQSKALTYLLNVPEEEADGFGFDVELLMMAVGRGYRIAEVPVNWADQPGSKVGVLRHGPRMLREVLSARRRLGRGR
jgi:cytochrome P450